MRVRKKIVDMFTTQHEMERIKAFVQRSKGRKVQWEMHRDGRKRQRLCTGVIGDAFAKHFTVTLEDGWKTSINYIDLLTGEVVLFDAETGKDILRDELGDVRRLTWEEVQTLEMARAIGIIEYSGR